MIPSLLEWTGWAASVPGWIAIFRRAGDRQVYGWFAVCNALFMASHALAGDRLAACLNACLGAYAAWLWWQSGGGDGTKRRLKSWARKFRGVRRTAPALGGAS